MVAVPTVSGPAELRCNLVDARIKESSGVAGASWSDDVVFTHNDSGDDARFFAVDARTCATRATYTVEGASNVDWEDMARGADGDGGPVLWLADIGDNQAVRSSVVIYEVAEPAATSAGGNISLRSRWTLTYPDGPHDAETVIVDPETGRPVVVTKDVAGGLSRVYRLPAEGSGVLEPLAQLDVRALDGGGLARPSWSVTGGATSPDRRRIVLRSYLAAWIWWVAPGETLAAVLARAPETLNPPIDRQPEAVSFTRDGRALWLTSEGAASPLHRLPLGSTPPGPGPTVRPPPAGGTVPAPAGKGRQPIAYALVVTGAVLLALVLILVALRSPRARRP